MSFKHIFGCIGRVTLVAESDWSISDVSVTIEAVTGGTYDIHTGDGHADRTGWSELVTESAYAIAPSAPGTWDLGVFLVPGTYQVTASWKATSGSFVDSYRDMSATVTVRAGESQDITVTLGGRLVFSTSVVGWDGPINVSEES